MFQISIEAYPTPEEAPKYAGKPEFRYARLLKVAVVGKGTQSGKSTLDLVLEDSKGQKYVAMIFSSFIPVLMQVIKGVEAAGEDLRPMAWYEETCGALVTDTPSNKFTGRPLTPETASSYGGEYVPAESMNVTTARILADALGYRFQLNKPE